MPLQIRKYTFHEQVFQYTDHTIHLPRSITEAMLSIIHTWQFIQPIEHTYAQREYQVPCIMVRLDCILDEHDVVRVYEIQEGCGWVGYTGIVNGAFRKIRDALARDAWPPFKVVLADHRREMDDQIWLKTASIPEALAAPHPIMLRGSASHLSSFERANLFRKSLKSVKFHNDKSYGLEFKWWREVTWNETDNGNRLPWEQGFVLKPIRAHGSQNVMIWNPTDRSGRATRTQIEKVLKRLGTMYVQDFIPPMHLEANNQRYNILLRPFFGFDPRSKEWKPMHGAWTGRPYPNLRLHGASDALTGPLILEY